MASVAVWESAGALFMVLAGTVLHYTFEWSGRSWIVGLFSAVNESVWEHLKLGFWPLVFFSLVEYGFLRQRVGNFAVAKAAGIVAFELIVLAGFYGYTSLLGRHILPLDIGLFVVGCAVCQLVSYRLLTRQMMRPAWQLACAAFLVLHVLADAFFTFRPPRLPLFREVHTGRYGMEPRNRER